MHVFLIVLLVAASLVGLAVTLTPLMRLKRFLAKSAERYEAEEPADRPVKLRTELEFDGLTPEMADEFINEFRECHSDDV